MAATLASFPRVRENGVSLLPPGIAGARGVRRGPVALGCRAAPSNPFKRQKGYELKAA